MAKGWHKHNNCNHHNNWSTSEMLKYIHQQTVKKPAYVILESYNWLATLSMLSNHKSYSPGSREYEQNVLGNPTRRCYGTNCIHLSFLMFWIQLERDTLHLLTSCLKYCKTQTKRTNLHHTCYLAFLLKGANAFLTVNWCNELFR